MELEQENISISVFRDFPDASVSFVDVKVRDNTSEHDVYLAEVGRANRVAACFANKQRHILVYFKFSLTAGVFTIAFRTRIARCGLLQWLFQGARTGKWQFFAHFCVVPSDIGFFKH